MNILYVVLHLYWLLGSASDAADQTEDQQGRTAYSKHSVLSSHPSIDRFPAFPGSWDDVIDEDRTNPNPWPLAHIHAISESLEEMIPGGGQFPPRYKDARAVAAGDDLENLSNFVGSEFKTVPWETSTPKWPSSPNYRLNTLLDRDLNHVILDREEGASRQKKIATAILRVLSSMKDQLLPKFPNFYVAANIPSDHSGSPKTGANVATFSLENFSSRRGFVPEPLKGQSEPSAEKDDVTQELQDSSSKTKIYEINGHRRNNQYHPTSFPEFRNAKLPNEYSGKNDYEDFREHLNTSPSFGSASNGEEAHPNTNNGKTTSRNLKAQSDGDVKYTHGKRHSESTLYKERVETVISKAIDKLKSLGIWDIIKSHLRSPEGLQIASRNLPTTVSLVIKNADNSNDKSSGQKREREFDFSPSDDPQSELIMSHLIQLMDAMIKTVKSCIKKASLATFPTKSQKSINSHFLENKEQREGTSWNDPPKYDQTPPFIKMWGEVLGGQKFGESENYIDKPWNIDYGKWDIPKLLFTNEYDERSFDTEDSTRWLKRLNNEGFHKFWKPMVKPHIKLSTTFQEEPLHYVQNVDKFLKELVNIYHSSSNKDARQVELSVNKDYTNLPKGTEESIEGGGGISPGKHAGGGFKIKIQRM